MADAMEECARVARISSGTEGYWELHRLAVADYVRADHYHAMTAKYEHAAQWPWLPVAPDQPEPTPDLSLPGAGHRG